MSESKQLQPVDEVRGALTKMGDQFKAALPPHISKEKFLRVAMTALQNAPSLIECDRHSLYGAFIRAAQDGLLPDGREGAIVPFKGRAQWIPMVGGILKKIRNSGELADLTVHLVREGEPFRYWVDETGKHLHHEPQVMGGDRGKPIGVYATLKTKDGGLYMDFMSAEEVEKVRQISKTKDRPDSPWSQWPDEMWKKSVLRRLSKVAPMSTDIVDMVQRDDDMYELNKPVQPQVTSGSGGPKRLQAIIEQKSEKSEPKQQKEPEQDAVPI